MSDAAPPRRRPVAPRHAASLIVVRRGGAAPEVLMGMRGAQHRFMPNRLVFPGGSVDRADYRGRCAAPLRPDVLIRLTKASTPRLAPALAHAAARELHEETGLSLGAPPHLDGLDYLCRAITPPESPIRFNARFMVVDAAAASGELAGSGELENLRYYPLQDALQLDLALVTRRVLEQLQAYLALTEAERRGRDRTPLLRQRVWHME
ncbi:MAG: NUDIX domain-containing protein [Alphaproteobacteria bacterium]|nr:NUDIX domain-containing protein [Alphaproteobacteria bacterium]